MVLELETAYLYLRHMVLATDEFSRKFESQQEPYRLLKEHRTVKFGLGRRMGHTTLGIQLANEWDTEFKAVHSRVLYLTHSPDTASLIKRQLNPGIHVGGFQTAAHYHRGRNLKLIVVDTASMAPPSLLDFCWRYGCNPMIVLLE